MHPAANVPGLSAARFEIDLGRNRVRDTLTGEEFTANRRNMLQALREVERPSLDVPPPRPTVSDARRLSDNPFDDLPEDTPPDGDVSAVQEDRFVDGSGFVLTLRRGDNFLTSAVRGPLNYDFRSGNRGAADRVHAGLWRALNGPAPLLLRLAFRLWRWLDARAANAGRRVAKLGLRLVDHETTSATRRDVSADPDGRIWGAK